MHYSWDVMRADLVTDYFQLTFSKEHPQNNPLGPPRHRDERPSSEFKQEAATSSASRSE